MPNNAGLCMLTAIDFLEARCARPQNPEMACRESSI